MNLLRSGFCLSGGHFIMAGKGNPPDNAIAESFFKTLTVEEVFLREYRPLENAQIRPPSFHPGRVQLP